MRQIAFLIFFFFGIGLSYSFTNKSNDSKKIDYTIIKIDSIKNWYFIYATRNDSVFKIVSIKNKNCKCERISIGKRYHLELQKRLENVLSKDGLKIIPMNYLDESGIAFDQNTDVFVPHEKGTFGLYSCKNMEGLCHDQK
jgi:hypothetical protein